MRCSERPLYRPFERRASSRARPSTRLRNGRHMPSIHVRALFFSVNTALLWFNPAR